jgi:hypothetical protein
MCCFSLLPNASVPLQTACELRTSVSKLLRDRLKSREPAAAENTVASSSYADAPDWVQELMDSVRSEEDVYSDDLGGETPALSRKSPEKFAFCKPMCSSSLLLFIPYKDGGFEVWWERPVRTSGCTQKTWEASRPASLPLSSFHIAFCPSSFSLLLFALSIVSPFRRGRVLRRRGRLALVLPLCFLGLCALFSCWVF